MSREIELIASSPESNNYDTRTLGIGLFGFGCVGQGLYDVLKHSQGLRADINMICVKDRIKPRSLDSSFFTYEHHDVLDNDTNNLIVELISEPDAALEIITRALVDGKDVVTANKKAVADNFELLYRLQLETGSSLLYEAACAGSIPIIRTLEEYYDNELLRSVSGILNGSSNFILSKMEREAVSFDDAVKLAQKLGFAEADPWLDVAGFDSKYKLCLLCAHAFGLVLKPDDIFNLGIQNINTFDINYAKEKNKRIKLLVHAEKSDDKFRCFVLPHFVDSSSSLGAIENENNAVEVEGVYSDKQLFVGKGAGSHPTGSAVLSDISAITYNYRYGYKKLKKREDAIGSAFHDDSKYLEDDFSIRIFVRYVNESELKGIEFENIEERYAGKDNSYLIGDVKFSSLKNLETSSSLFVCSYK